MMFVWDIAAVECSFLRVWGKIALATGKDMLLCDVLLAIRSDDCESLHFTNGMN